MMGGAISDSVGNKRAISRQPVLRAAKVLFGGSAVDCLVLDYSAHGIRVSTDVLIPFPEEVTIELRSGGTWAARLRWQRGMETGFKFERFVGLTKAAAAEASSLFDQLRNAGVLDVTERLATAKYFDHAGLQAAAETAELAVRGLEHALGQAAGRPMK